MAVYGLCGVVCVVSQRFHLERSPDERAHSLGVVVAHRLREIVVVRAVAAQVGLLHVLGYCGARARAEAGHGATVGQRDSAVGVDLDEVVDDSAVSAYSRVAVFGSEVAFSVCLEQRVGKHGRACRLEIVAFAPRAVHHLIPHPGLLVLPFYHGIEVFLEQVDDLRAAFVVFGKRVEQFDERHGIPSLGPSPAVLRQSCCLVGPEHLARFVPCVAVEARLRVERTVVSLLYLVYGVVVNLARLLVAEQHLGGHRVERQAHEYAVEPHLVGVDGLVPVYAFVGAGLVFHLLHERLDGLQVLFLGIELIHACHEMARADVVEVVVFQLVAPYLALVVYHRVGVELAIVFYFLASVLEIRVEHGLELDAHDIAPLRFL